MKLNDKIIIFRPQVSSYQSKNFRDEERKSFSNNLYFSSFEELLKVINKESKIVFISTSNIDPDLYEEIFNNITIWIHPNSGYDNLPLSFIKEANFPIINGNSIRADAVFQYIVKAFLDSLGPIPFLKKWDEKREFQKIDFYSLKTLIIGHGHIGKRVSSFLKLTNITFDIYDPYTDDSTISSVNDLSKFDSIFLCCGLNSSSKHILGENLSSAKKNLVIINAARGGLINETLLINFLSLNVEARAFIDVFENEPMDLTIFSELKNIFTSSHIAGVYNNIDREIISFEQSILFDILNLDSSAFLDKYKSSNLKNKIRNGSLI